MTGPNRWERSCFVLGWGAFCVGVMLATANVAFAESRAERYDIHIVEARLGAALTALALQTDKQLFFPYDLADAQGVHPVSGNYTVDEALDLMLRDTGFSGGLTDSGVITISRVASTDSEGGTMGSRDQKSSPNKRKGLLGILAAAFSVGAGAQEAADSVEGGFGGELEEIVVTGTNIRGANNPTVPLITFDRDEIDLSGIGTVQEFVRTIPQNYSTTARQSTTGPSTVIDLRGLGSGTTLTLLNGRRLSPTSVGAAVDVSVLPLSLIDRIEIVPDGSSAIYGADAVGGVVNFLTRREYEGVETRARIGSVTEGERREYQVGLTAGTNWSSGGGFVNVGYTDLEPLLASDREELVDPDAALLGGTLFPDEEYLNVFASVEQSLTARLLSSADVLYTKRDVGGLSINFLQLPFENQSDTLAVSTVLAYELSNNWNLSAFFDYALDDSTRVRELPSGFDTVEFSNSNTVGEARIAGEFLSLPGGALAVAFGGSYRKENFEEVDGGEISIEGDRNIYAIYGEILVPVIGPLNDIPLVRRFDISLAGRYEDYSDFGDTFNPKVGLSWEPFAGLSFRGSYSQSFRAPILEDVSEIPTINVFPFPGDQAFIALGGGNPDLAPEEAESWTVGMTMLPDNLPGLKAEFTYFDISYDGRIQDIGVPDILFRPEFEALLDRPADQELLQTIFGRLEAGEARLVNFTPGDPGPEDIDFLVRSGLNNLSALSVTGLDVGLSYETSTEIGDLSAALNGTYLFDYIRQFTDRFEPVDVVDTLFNPVDLKLRGTVSWSRNGFAIFTAVNYTDSYTDDATGAELSSIDAWTTVDITLAYDSGNRFERALFNNAKLSITAQNVLNELPPFSESIGASNFGLNFDALNASSLGRFVSFQITKAW